MSHFNERKDLGELAAEKDRDLDKYFLESHPSFKTCIDFNNRKFLLIGRTGAGKSAILEYIRKKMSEDNDYVVAHVNATSDNLMMITESSSEFFEEKENDNFLYLTYKIAWYYIIALETIKNYYTNSSLLQKFWADFSYKDKAVDAFISKVNKSMDWENKSIVELFVEIAKKAQIEAELSSKKGKIKVTISDLVTSQSKFYVNTKRFVEEDLVKMLGKKSLYVLIDEIDKGWTPESESQQIFIRSLYNVLHSLSILDNIKPLAAIRTNIFHEVDWKIQSIKMKDDIVSIKWTLAELQDFIEMRLAHAFGISKVGIWTEIFDKNIGFRDILERTLMRPRDLLLLFQMIVDRAYEVRHEVVYRQDVEDVLNEYSLTRLNALEDEWETSYPNLVNFLGSFHKACTENDIKQGFKPKNFRAAMMTLSNILQAEKEDYSWFTSLINDERNSKDDTMNVAKKLYTIGLLSIYDRGIYIFASEDKEYMPKLKDRQKLKISPVFLPFVQSRPALGSSKDDTWDKW